VKNPLKILLASLLLVAAILFSLQGVTGVDPWVKNHRNSQKLSIFPENESPPGQMKFFNTLAIGGSFGYSWFHGSLADYETFAPIENGGEYYKFAWRIHASRDIKWGLRGKVQFEKGSLTGGRLPGLQSLPVDFETDFNTFSLLLNYDLLNTLFNKKYDSKGLKGYKFFFYGEVGIGITWFRSVSWWDTERNQVRDYVGYTVTDPEAPTSRYLLKAKDSPEIALNIPIGFTAGYRINHQTDVTISYMLNNTMTKKLDTWSREFNSNDKYSYIGIGLRYNFNREKKEYPPKKKKEDKDEKKKWKLFGSKKEDVEPNDVELNEPLESRKSNPINAESQNDDLEEIRMKMFELQLKLFEMQYLLNGGKKPATPATPVPTKPNK